jgi:Domain of unknown function (DUF4845)
MNTRQRQSGMSILGILSIMLMVGFFIMCAIRMVPPYLEYRSVQGIISRIVMEPEVTTESAADLRRKIATRFNTNQIYLLDPKEVEVFSKGGKTYIDANYEARLPILWRIDAVMKFDDLLYELGDPKPLPKPPPATKK